MGSQRVGHDWTAFTFIFTFYHVPVTLVNDEFALQRRCNLSQFSDRKVRFKMCPWTCRRSHGSKEWAGLSVLLWMPATSFLFPWPSAAFLASRSFVADVSALCVFTLNMAKGLTPDVSSWCETPDVFSLNWGRGRETPGRSNYPRALCAQRHRDAS